MEKNTLKKENLLLEGMTKLERLIGPYGDYTYNELLEDLKMDGYEGCEELVAIMLMMAEDPVMKWTERRLFLQLYEERMSEKGSQAVVKWVEEVLQEEKEKWEDQMRRMDKQKEQEQLQWLTEQNCKEIEANPIIEE